MTDETQSMTTDTKTSRRIPLTGPLPGLVEIAVVLGAGLSVILVAASLAGSKPIAMIAAVWSANVVMLAMIYFGLRTRGQDWSALGLEIRMGGWRSISRAFVQSLPVFFAAIGSFVLGAILMANLLGMPEPADMTKYDYLRGNLGITVLALLSVYVVSSFAEEVIYRGFLMTRLTEARNGVGKIWVALILSSVLFGLVHSDWGIAGMVQASFMGLVLGASFLIVNRNLWVTILAHGYMDTILILQMYFAGT